MKWIIGLGLLVLLIALTSFTKHENIIVETKQTATLQDTTFDVAAAIGSIKEEIKGREEEPASEVFKNVQLLGQIPAGRILAIMERAFNGSLGVTCDHCHNPRDWSSDEKKEKLITREMWKMMGTINQELLGSIKDLKGTPPSINCTTCHRGDVKPKLSMR